LQRFLGVTLFSPITIDWIIKFYRRTKGIADFSCSGKKNRDPGVTVGNE
jgi:hypothetical protein